MEEFIIRLFKKARKDLLYPPIHKIEFADIDLSEIDFSQKYKILISKNAVKKLSYNALLGVFHHELNHWAKHPYDAKTIILEEHYLGSIPNRTEIRNLYDDIVVNLDLIINKELFEIAVSFQEIPPVGSTDKVLRAFYKKITGLNFGNFELEPELKEKVNSLFKIDFLNTSKQALKQNIRTFAHILKDIIIKETSTPFSTFSLKKLPSQEIKKALKNLSKELEFYDYRQIVDMVSKEISSGISPGDISLIQELKKPDIRWYESKAIDYTIYIESIFEDGSLYPFEIKDFRVEDNIDFYMPVESYAKLIPGIAKKYTLDGFEGCGDLIPSDAIIIIDSSGSMAHPDIKLSYAVLSAFCIARNYIENGSKVGVINFSDRNINLIPTNNKQKIYETLKIYQGGGTTFHIEDFKDYIKMAGLNEKGEIDYIIITDAGIHNLEALIDHFSKIRGRITILWINTDESFKERYHILKNALPKSVTFIEVKDTKDLPKIAVGEAFRKYVYQRIY